MSMYENKNNLLRQRSDEVCETLCYNSGADLYRIFFISNFSPASARLAKAPQ